VIPVEVTQTPWHYTTFWDWVDHWQTLIAGGFALLAGFGTVVGTMIIARRQIAASRDEANRVIAATREQTETTVRLERERISSELDALRKSLGVELRQQIPGAFRAYDNLRGLASKPDGPITARMVASKAQMPAPIIFSANAGKIGLLEGDAMDVLIVYTLLEDARGYAARLTIFRTPDDISSAVVMETAQVFLMACECARDFCRDCAPVSLRMTPKTRH
jgi:hypothetical protein